MESADTHAAKPRIVVITGLSGSGKSTAIRALEDLGYFCIDNLPVVLLPKMTELAAAAGAEIHLLAIVVDAREGRFLSDAPRRIEDARRSGNPVEVVYLDASDDVLIRRFSETRRRHPLAPRGTVPDGIRQERELLSDLRKIADQVIDTSTLTVHELKNLIQSRFAPSLRGGPSVTVVSFGYRFGIPPQADLVFDARFLPNPFFVPDLKAYTGRDPRVAAYVLERPETRDFLDRLVSLCDFLLPHFQREGKAYLTVAVGCTGGKHRSVAIAHALADKMNSSRVAQVWDRDSDKE
jgi:RNase adapter protein RapZ